MPVGAVDLVGVRGRIINSVWLMAYSKGNRCRVKRTEKIVAQCIDMVCWCCAIDWFG